MKTRLLFFISSLLICSLSQAQEVARISLDQLVQGRSWTWLYSEWKSPMDQWSPYYLERYTVLDRTKDLLTFEMSSSPFEENQLKAHHRFVLDFRKCEKAGGSSAARAFSVILYRKTPEGAWELVSQFHPGYIFKEKFNCHKRDANEVVTIEPFQGFENEPKIFNINSRGLVGQGSWYFLEDPVNRGVAARKNFPPELSYKFELIQ